MPSNSLSQFENNMLQDVEKLIGLHKSLSKGRAGKKGLGHITRSGVVMLCAAWELYLECLIREAVDCLCNRIDSPKDLPKEVQKTLARHVKEDKHELKPLELAGDGWRTCYKLLSNSLIDRMNTPKTDNINELFKRFIGLEELSSKWSKDYGINDFVTQRGDIAHKGNQAKYVKLWMVESYKENVWCAAIETDNIVGQFLRDSTPGNKLVWRQRAL